MENFWDFIFYKKIVSIQEADFDFRNSEKLQMDYESELAQDKLTRNKTFRAVFMIIFSAFNLCIFGIQYAYIMIPSLKHGGSDGDTLTLYRSLISTFGIILFIIDVYMTCLFIRITQKFIELMIEKETERKNVIIVPGFFAVLLLVRGVSENLFRTGSQIVYMLNGN